MDRLTLITSREYWIETLEYASQNGITDYEIADNIAKKMEEALKLYSVVFNEAEAYVPTNWNCQKQCDCTDKNDCNKNSEVELFCRVCKSHNIKHHPEEYYECLQCGHEFTK